MDTKSKAEQRTEVELPAKELSAFPFYNHYFKDIVLTTLAMHGVKRVEVSFDGSGDSGQIELPHFEGDAEVNAMEIDYPISTGTLMQDGQWVDTYKVQKTSLSEIIRNVTSEFLNSTNLDWYNNDGGRGDMYIDFSESPPRIELRVSIRRTEYDEYEFYANNMTEET